MSEQALPARFFLNMWCLCSVFGKVLQCLPAGLSINFFEK